MKNKAIIAFILIVAMALSVTIALAEQWTPSPLVSETEWDVMNGQFGGSFSNGGVYSLATDYSSAAHKLTASSDGNFDLKIPFKLNGNETVAYVGLSTASSAQDTSGWTVIGNGPGNALGFSHGGLSNIEYFGDTAPTMGTTYTAHFTSTDGGQHATIGVDGYGSTRTVSLSGPPTFAVIYLKNNGILGQPDAVPVVLDIIYNYQKAAASPSTSPSVSPGPTVSPSPAPTTNPQAQFMLDLQSIRDFYARQPVVHMSNQSVIYNQDGTIARVITGDQANAPNATIMPNATAMPTVKPNATAMPANTTVTPVPSVPAPTKTQSPGFEMVLAAIGMLSALALITRKKK